MNQVEQFLKEKFNTSDGRNIYAGHIYEYTPNIELKEGQREAK